MLTRGPIGALRHLFQDIQDNGGRNDGVVKEGSYNTIMTLSHVNMLRCTDYIHASAHKPLLSVTQRTFVCEGLQDWDDRGP
jgi:hypothetical protein